MTEELDELIKEQKEFIAVEEFSGNIVKKEFHKGALFGLELSKPNKIN